MAVRTKRSEIDAAAESLDSMEGVPIKQISKEASVVGGVDIGGKNTEVSIKTKDGRVGHAIVETFQKTDDMLVHDRVAGLVDSTMKAILRAAQDGNIKIDEIDALGFGAPGARNPESGYFRMPNAIGTADGTLVDVDFEHQLRKKLMAKGFRQDSIIRGWNDCDIAAGAIEYGETRVVNEARDETGRVMRDWKELKEGDESFFALLGTGIGIGWATKDGIKEGASGAMEGGHVWVHTNIPGLKCGCGKPGNGQVCVEAAASTTGQENITKLFVRQAFDHERQLKRDDMKILLSETRNWNQKKMEGDLSQEDANRHQNSVYSIDSLIGHLDGTLNLDRLQMAKDVKRIVFDAATIDRLACGETPQVELAADAMETAGEHFGRYLNQVIHLNNPRRIIIGGGGAKTFKYGDPETNPFWRGMNKELFGEGGERDPFASARKTWIIAAVGDHNLGIDGSMNFARLEYSKGEG